MSCRWQEAWLGLPPALLSMHVSKQADNGHGPMAAVGRYAVARAFTQFHCENALK